jgi:hypothetical protein
VEDIGYPVIPFFFRIVINQSGKEDESYGCHLNDHDLYCLCRKRVTGFKEKQAIPRRKEKLGGGTNGD